MPPRGITSSATLRPLSSPFSHLPSEFGLLGFSLDCLVSQKNSAVRSYSPPPKPLFRCKKPRVRLPAQAAVAWVFASYMRGRPAAPCYAPRLGRCPCRCHGFCRVVPPSKKTTPAALTHPRPTLSLRGICVWGAPPYGAGGATKSEAALFNLGCFALLCPYARLCGRGWGFFD